MTSWLLILFLKVENGTPKYFIKPYITELECKQEGTKLVTLGKLEANYDTHFNCIQQSRWGNQMTYVLIMTIWMRASNYVPVITIAEFSSKEACVYASAQQEVALRTDFQLNTSKYFTAVCVPK